MGEKIAKVIAVGNQKGGVGKTTNTLHMAVALAELGRRVLVVDLDMNTGATILSGIPPEMFAHASLLQVMAGEVDPEEAILSFEDDDLDVELPQNFDILPASRELEEVDKVLGANDPFFSPKDCLFALMKSVRALGRYDYVFLDTGPTATTPTKGAYMVSDYFIVTVVPELLALEGMGKTLRDIAAAKQPGRNENLQLLGVLVSGLDRRVRKARVYAEELGEKFKQAGDAGRFDTVVKRAAAISNAQREKKTVLQTEPTHEVAKQFNELAREIEARISRFEAQRGDAAALTANA